MEPGYRIFDHTADVGLDGWGSTAAEAFAAAARGMFAIILGADPTTIGGVGPARPLTIEAAGEGWGELLVNWLVEFLFQFEVDDIVPLRIAMHACQPPRCAAGVEGAAIENADAPAGVGVKAVTYHDLKVEVAPERTDIHVIFDI